MDKRVLLTGEIEILETENGRECFSCALRLLVRICGKLTVSLPKDFGAFDNECESIAKAIEFGDRVELEIRGSANLPSGFDAVLNIGSRNLAGLPCTVVNSNGWLVRICSTGADIDAICTQTNPIGSLAAASLGVSEVFKRLLMIKDLRGPLFGHTTFSLYSYSAGDLEPGPALPKSLRARLTLFGAGAIGNEALDSSR